MTGISTWRRRVSAATAGVVTACAVLSTASAGSLARADVPSQPLVPGRMLSGDVGVGGQKAIDAFSAFRGKPVQVVQAYTSTSDWATIEGVTRQGLTKYWDNSDAHMVWSMPLLPAQQYATLEIAATGAYNGHYASVAQQLIAGGDGAATIRLGWEMTGNWYTWSGQSDPAAFAAAWRQAVSAMRAVPGAHFTFDFNTALGFADPTAMYPGDAYVDLIGADVYDNSWAWDYPASNHQRVWNQLVTEPWGLTWLASFAAQHGKRLSFPEWGVQWTCDGHGGVDDPYFIQQFYAWMQAHNVAYEAYLNADTDSCTKSDLQDGLFPQSAAMYRKVVSAATPPVSAPPVSAPPVSAPPVSKPPVTLPAAPSAALSLGRIQLSSSPTRSNGGWLFGATVTGAAYIWLADATGTTQVRFYLDRPTTGPPSQTETSAPWDFKGGSAAAANPVPAGSLTPGVHQLSVVATMTGGGVQSATVSFTVR